MLILSMPYGVVAIAWSYVLANIISTIINIYPNKDILKYSYFEQFKDIVDNLIVAVIMGGIVWTLTLLPIGWHFMLVLQLIVGALTYVFFSKLFKIESYSYLMRLTKEQINGRLKCRK